MTLNTYSTERVYSKLKKVWASFLYDAQSAELNIDIISKYPFLNYFDNNNIAYAVLDVKEYKLLYRNQYFYNIMGISEVDYLHYGDSIVLGNFDSTFTDFNISLAKYVEKVWSNLAFENKKDLKTCAAGATYNHPIKGSRRFFIQSYVLAVDNNNYPIHSLILYQDISHLLKNNIYWFRVFCDNEMDKMVAYHSELREIPKGDIISTREKEILKLISLGKATEEIADTLFISKATVNNHRQNMLNRLGVRDTTALIQLANLAKIL